MTSNVIDLERGQTYERIEPSQIEKGDKVRYYGHGVAYVIKHPVGKDTSQLKMPIDDVNFYHCYYIARPQPGYYALMPLSVPFDIATSPIQLIVYAVGSAVAPPVGDP
jgi:hypothetical protein